MAPRDYVGSNPRRRAPAPRRTAATKSAPKGRSEQRTIPLIPALMVGGFLVAFAGFLFYLNRGDAPSIAEQVRANKQRIEEPQVPQEKWSYMERLENKQVEIVSGATPAGVLPPPPAETVTLQSGSEVTPAQPAPDLSAAGSPPTTPTAPNAPAVVEQPIPDEAPEPIAEPVVKPQPMVKPQAVVVAKSVTTSATTAPAKPAPKPVVLTPSAAEIEAQMRAEQAAIQPKPVQVKPQTQAPVTQSVATPKPIASSDSNRYILQCAALRSKESAESLKAKIAFSAGLSASIQTVNSSSGPIYKVVVGTFNGKAAADSANQRLVSNGVGGCLPKKG